MLCGRFVVKQGYYKKLMSNCFAAMSSIEHDVSNMRIDYKTSHIDDQNLPSKNPYEWFKKWLDEAVKHPNVIEANAMNIATCSKDGWPSARMVLLKGFSENGFRFFSNHLSQKGRDLAENPRAALTFYWEPLQMQVRICGEVEPLPDGESIEYFNSRPAGSKFGALVSKQSSVIPNSKVTIKYLEERNQEIMKEYEGKEVPKPEYWGGYLVKPRTYEFWCGRSSRLHDRIRFRRPASDEKIDEVYTKSAENGWVFEVLAP